MFKNHYFLYGFLNLEEAYAHIRSHIRGYLDNQEKNEFEKSGTSKKFRATKEFRRNGTFEKLASFKLSYVTPDNLKIDINP